MNGTWHFHAKDRDDSVRPQDDFYHYANGGWIQRHPVPKTESHWGTFMILRFETEKKLKAIMDELLVRPRAKIGTPEQLLGDFFRSGMDMKHRNALGLTPLAPLIQKIRKITTVAELQTTLVALHRLGIGALFNAGIDQDSKNTKRYLLHFFQDGLGMPDREYYLNNDAESIRVRTAYEQHLVAMFRLMGRTIDAAKHDAGTVFALETRIARVSMNKVDRREIEKTYNKFTRKALQGLAPAIDWKQYLEQIGADDAREFIVMQPNFFTAISKLIHSVELADWKVYLEWNVVNDFAMHLSAKLARQNFEFYGKTLSGTKAMKPLWRQALATVNAGLGELLGQLYVKKHFPPAAKRAMNLLVDDLFIAYEARIKGLDWMGSATKKKALGKLAAMNRKIGYPDKWKSFRGLRITADDYAGNLVRTAEFIHKREMKKLAGPIDRTEWFMYPQTVNAYNAPNMNEIVFPAAILQPPFFTLGGDAAQNYGSMGSVIAHEISHGFDDEGAKFDKDGNFKTWWTPTDKKRFEQRSKVLVKQFNTYELSGVRVNGKLTLGENIADLGGASIAYDAYMRELVRSGRTLANGYTPEQRFFLGFGLFERENSTPEFIKTQILTDPHAPHIFRVNGPMSNLPEFYSAFEVKKGDKLYRTPKERARIW